MDDEIQIRYLYNQFEDLKKRLLLVEDIYKDYQNFELQQESCRINCRNLMKEVDRHGQRYANQIYDLQRRMHKIEASNNVTQKHMAIVHEKQEKIDSRIEDICNRLRNLEDKV